MALRILYNSQDPAHKTPFGVVTPGQSCTMNIAIPVSVQTTQVVLVIQQENGTHFRDVEFRLDHVEDPYEYYQVTFSFNSPGLFFYFFKYLVVTGILKSFFSVL